MTHYLIYDQIPDRMKKDSYFHFALADALIRQVNKHPEQTMLHFWPTDKKVILGMMDTKLPYLSDGISSLENEGYEVVVRPSGGLAVISDPGILNFSFIIAEPENKKLSIDDGYETMVAIVRQAFSAYGKEIKAYEITDSYCPGTFDLSIDGKKFAGIAQRRFRRGIGVMIYLSVDGNQQERGQVIRNFYQTSLKGEETRWHYPDVNPDSMANLTELLDPELTIQAVQDLLTQAVIKNTVTPLDRNVYDSELLTEYNLAYDKMIKRNEKILPKERENEKLP